MERGEEKEKSDQSHSLTLFVFEEYLFDLVILNRAKVEHFAVRWTDKQVGVDRPNAFLELSSKELLQICIMG